MEFTGFCYSNSRVSPFYFGGEMFVWRMGGGSNRRTASFEEIRLLLCASDCSQTWQVLFEDW